MTKEERSRLKLYCFERQLIAFQLYGEELIQEIKKSFSNNKYPGDENIVGCKCEECGEYYEFFVGKTWQDCLGDESYRKLCGGQSFFKSSAWHYYLPSYLSQLIKHKQFRSSYDFEEKVEEDIPDLTKWQMEKINLLSSQQCQAIIDYLEIALQVWQGIEKGYQDDVNPLMFWKQNHQKALAKEQNLNK